MQNCHYTNSTIYTFNQEICDGCANLNYLGITPEEVTANALAYKPLTNTWVQFSVPKIMDIPSQKPSIEGLVSVNSCVDIISQRVIITPSVTDYTNFEGVLIPGTEIANGECTTLTGRKLIIEGVITQKLIYTALLADQALHSATFQIPFSTFIILPKDTALSQDFKIQPYLEDAFVCQLSERSFFSNTTLFIKAAPAC